MAMFYRVAGASEPTSVSFTLHSSNNWIVEMTEFSGGAAAAPFDVSTSNTGSVAAVTCSALGTLAEGGELVFTAYSDASANTFGSYDNSQAQSQQVSNSTNCTLATASVVVSSTASVNYGATESGSGGWLAIAAAFKPLAATDSYSLSSTLGAATGAGTFTHTPTDSYSLSKTLGAATASGDFGSIVPYKITDLVQHLEPGAYVVLYEIDCTSLGDTVHRFHGYAETGNIIWQGNTYYPWPVEAAGFQRTSDQQPVPTISVGNVDGSISALCLAFNDLCGATIKIHKTLSKFLDAANFAGGNVYADPTQEASPEQWTIERKAHEDSEFVQFELASPLDLDGVQLPRRQIIANVCSWIAIGGYRGPFCGYTGGAVAKADDTATSDPAQDVCGGRVSSCKLRFGANNQLPFGGFPAARLIN